MHRTDADANVANQFSDGDPAVPRQGTLIDAAWSNAVQEEIVGVIADAGIPLVKGTWTQLLSALKASFLYKTGAQAFAGVKTFSDGIVVSALSSFAAGVTFAAGITVQAYSSFTKGLISAGTAGTPGGDFTAAVGAPAGCVSEGPGADNTAPAYGAAGTLSMSAQGAIAKTASPGANVICREMVSKAWATIRTVGSSTGYVDDAINVSGISFPGSNVLRVTFAQAMANTNYAVNATAYLTAGAGFPTALSLQSAAKAAGYVDMVFVDTTNAVYDAAVMQAIVNVDVKGRQ